MKYLLVSGVLFEELGYTYFGPIDGHNIPLLLETLQQADQVDGPTLIHVITIKGKGYKPAEADAMTWHGITPYKIESGELRQELGETFLFRDLCRDLDGAGRDRTRGSWP